MQFIVNSHANHVTESLVQKRLFKNVNDSFSDKAFYFSKTKIHLQPMTVKGSYCLSFDDFEC